MCVSARECMRACAYGWGKGSVWVNGFNLGRYWEAAGPQVCVWAFAYVCVAVSPAGVCCRGLRRTLSLCVCVCVVCVRVRVRVRVCVCVRVRGEEAVCG